MTKYANEWEGLLALPLDELTRAMVDEADAGKARRQASPFAGALAPRERWRLWRDVKGRAAVAAGFVSESTLLARLATMGLDASRAEGLATRIRSDFGRAP